MSSKLKNEAVANATVSFFVSLFLVNDNDTLYDRFKESRPDAGEEFLRFKPIYDEDGNITGYDHNSYASGDGVNNIKWNTLDEADKQQVFDYYKGLIAFRKAHAAFRMTTEEQVTENILAIDGLEANVTAFAINGGVNGEVSDGLFVIFNANEKAIEVELPEGKWNVY